MKISFSVIILIILGIVAATAAAMFTATLSAGRIGDALSREVPDITILVAAEDLALMTPLRADDIVEKTIQPSEAPANHFTDSSQIIGKRISAEMFVGQAFTRGSFPHEGSGAQLASQIPPGKRAVNIQIASYESLGGLLYPGAHVDVIASFRVKGRDDGSAISTTLLQDIQVLAVANELIGDNSIIEDKEANLKNKVSKQPSVTLLLTTKEVEALQLAMKFGQISLSMRNPGDKNKLEDEATMLSEGLIAKLATMLGTSVTNEQVAKPVVVETAKAEPVPVQEPVKATKTLRVSVMHGLELETPAFQLSN